MGFLVGAGHFWRVEFRRGERVAGTLEPEVSKMSRQVSAVKLAKWSERLRRYRASGLTVSRFCESERVTASSFYYWSRRLSSGSRAVEPDP
jgi:hypothetical protein